MLSIDCTKAVWEIPYFSYSLLTASHSSSVEGSFTNSSESAIQIASDNSLTISQMVDFPMQNSKDSDACRKNMAV